jgi:hypothetical protein
VRDGDARWGSGCVVLLLLVRVGCAAGYGVWLICVGK